MGNKYEFSNGWETVSLTLRDITSYLDVEDIIKMVDIKDINLIKTLTDIHYKSLNKIDRKRFICDILGLSYHSSEEDLVINLIESLK